MTSEGPEAFQVTPDAPPTDPVERRRYQQRLVRSGCASCLGCLTVVVVLIGGYAGFDRLLRSATLGARTPDLFVIQEPRLDAIAWITPVTLIMAFGLMGVAKTWFRTIVWGGSVFAIGIASVVLCCYTNFVAIRARPGREVDLIYLWPRPSVSIDPRGAVFHVEQGLSSGDAVVVLLEYGLVIEHGGHRYRSAFGFVDKEKALLLQRGAVGGEVR